jgi:formylglycine-generating enzyme required for sulfatase activity
MMRQAARHYTRWGLVLVGILALAGWLVYEGYGGLKAQALRDRLLGANTADLPAVVADLAPYRRWLDPLLRDAYRQAEGNADGRKQLHAALALLPIEPERKHFLYDRLLDAAPPEVPVLCTALALYGNELTGKLWDVAERPAAGQEGRRLRAACALAEYDPSSPRWESVREQVAGDLVSVPAVHLAPWLNALRPVSGHLLGPLTAIYRDGKRRALDRALATDVLAEYAADQPEVLADLLCDADEKQFAVLFPRLRAHGSQAPPLLAAEIAKGLPPDASDDARERLAGRQANAAVALLRLGRSEAVWPLLQHDPDPRRRSYLIDRLGPMGVRLGAVLGRLEEEPDVTIRSALVLSLGEFDDKGWPADARNAMADKLRRLYRTADDPGLRGAAKWLLRHWKQDRWLERSDETLAKDEEQRGRRLERIHQELAKGAKRPQWYVNGQGQTLVVLPAPGEIQVGSPDGEAERMTDEQRHPVRLGRSFAIAARPVTVEQFLRFRPGHAYDAKFAPDRDCPVNSTTWYDAAAYCNWLSEQEGLPEEEWCYLPNKDGKYADGMKLAPNYLRRTGYRLPTEAEWEYACRAGTVTSRYYGETEALLEKYAWYMKNSGRRTWPVGSLKPNDWGLFDMHGNVWTWCQERYFKEYAAPPGGRAVEDAEDEPDVRGTELRVLRGGAAIEAPAEVRAARRVSVHPGRSINYVGLRPARTFR